MRVVLPRQLPCASAMILCSSAAASCAAAVCTLPAAPTVPAVLAPCPPTPAGEAWLRLWVLERL